MNNLKKYIVILLSILMVFACSCSGSQVGLDGINDYSDLYIDLATIPEYCGNKYVVLNDNIQNFSESELYQDSFEKYSELE